jgi:rhodanese-related sulfurtransferase
VNFIINNIFLISIVVVSAFLLLLPSLQRRGPHLPPFQVTQRMNRERVVFLDIRKPDEYATAHLRNAINITADDLLGKLGRIERYKADPIVIICATGSRAPRATSQLKKLGFKDVSSMEGGMKAWQDQGMPVESSSTEVEKDKGKKKGKA